ncbi:MAG: aldo/keto reductase, partial [Nitrospirae bacterium]|nr:aldo/keto reductase [Nitrospirota bacterium]
ARRLAELVLEDFRDAEHGGFFTTARDHEALILRSREGPDGATPSGNAVAASVLARLAFHFGRTDFREAATEAIRAYGRQVARYPRAFAKSLAVVDLLLTGPTELALIGTPGEPGYEALHAEVNRHYLPNRIIAHHDPNGPATQHPLLIGKGKGLVNGKAALYICRNFACQAPIAVPEAVAEALHKHVSGGATDSTAGQKALDGRQLQGHATAGGTGAYAVRFVNHSRNTWGYGPLGSTGLTVSKLGFGGYRVDEEEPEHRAALVKALREGCNLIDTSTNYMDGESERLVGSVLAELIAQGNLTRNEVIVVSKIGYVQGQNLKQAEAREKAGKPYPDMVKYGEGIWHCLHPEFLADQLHLSLDRLGLDTLDVCLLHNPEYFLSDAMHRREDQSTEGIVRLRKRFYDRLQQAFAYFEAQVAASRLQYYGVSSNTCTAPAENPEATSLSLMLDAATAAAEQAGSRTHHFRVLQCPMNLLESGALLTANTGPSGKQALLDLAREAGMAVLVNRPLNAMPAKGGTMIRLAELPIEPSTVSFESQKGIVAGLEQEYRREIAPQVPHSGQGLSPQEYFTWADELAKIRPRIQSLEHWEQVENQMIAPHINQVLRALTQIMTGELGDRWQDWRERYLPELLVLLKELRREATIKSRDTTSAITTLIDVLLPEAKRKEPLSRKALWVVASTPGVTSVLNGMRTPAYVDDSMAILNWEPLPNIRPICEALKAAS